MGPDATRAIIKIAILAVGGQGGGVLTGWIVQVAEAAGWHVQATSVAGVAQRTGATIYYIETVRPDPTRGDRRPVLALSPAPGDIDVLIAAELAEAGRAVLRGFVSPARTTLIASTHRALAVSEKIVPGDGRADADLMLRHAREAARRTFAFDMEAIAREAGSVVSASLFGALAASGELPFPRDLYETVIRSGGKGAEASLDAFGRAYARAAAPEAPPVPQPVATPPTRAAIQPEGPARLRSEWDALLQRVARMPAPVRAMAGPGLAKVVDFLDPAYGGDYLDRLDRALAGDDPARGHAFAREAAKHLANAMVYDDIVRVADLKTRGARTERVRRTAGVAPEQPLATTEYFHPRMAEASGLLPARLGAALLARPRLVAALDRFLHRGWRIRSDGVAGFALLYALAGLRRWRRGMLRHGEEITHLDRWFGLALATRDRDYALGAEVLRCRRLVKGYSDTHARGLSKFDRVLSALPMLAGRPDAADWLRRLREAALADPDGTALDGALRTIASFAAEPALAAE